MSEFKPSLLIVDDVEANVLALEALLAELPCQFVRAHSGNDALKQLLKRDFAAVLLDVQMPAMDGFEVARIARDNPTTRDVPIIFITAMHASDENVLKGYGTGAVDLLFKPVNAEVLRAKVRVFIELYMGRRALSVEVNAHKLTLEQLQKSNAALQHFTDAASHDLRAPLRAVRGFLTMLNDECADVLGTQAQHYLARARSAAERMDSLLSSLLTHARLRRPSENVLVDLNEVAGHVLEDLSAQIEAARATVQVGTLPTVRGESDLLYQLLLNLLSNAIKYRRPDTPLRVELSASRASDSWLLSVSDNGRGIAPADQQRIFEAFSRLHQQEQVEGVGLGLAICQQIVTQHGGRMWVDSQPGSGSRFFVALPVAHEPL